MKRNTVDLYMLNRPIRNIHDFLLSTYFADGLRITFGVLCPSLIMAQFGMLQYGMTLSLGAVCISVVDSPGPIVHRRNAMLITTALIVIVSILVGITNKNIYFTGTLLVICSFVFSMLFLYGARAASIGTSVLLIMVLSIDDVRPWKEVLLYAMLIFCGSIWYTLLSYFIYRIRPYRLVQQMLSESIHEVSIFLRAKAKFYHEGINYEKNYAELLQLQVIVHEKQEEVREVLFKTREIVNESTPEGRFLLLVFVDMVDLFEQIMSTYYNYQQLHQQFDEVGILTHYEEVINKIADSLEDIAFALKTGGTPKLSVGLTEDIEKLKQEILALENNKVNQDYNTLGLIALKNIEVNIENILSRVKTIKSYFNEKEKKKLKRNDIDVDKFVTKQSFDIKLFRENLTFSSSTFRHSLRVAIVMLIGFVVAKSLDFAHSYWILLTIIVILKPGYSLTKQRNIERMIGTVIGGIIGLGVLTLFPTDAARFGFLVFFMLLSYSFIRIKYVVSVLFMTPYILIVFSFTTTYNDATVAWERIIDTFIGAVAAILGSYFVFPSWESYQLKTAVVDMLQSNVHYLSKIVERSKNSQESQSAYRLARKALYVNSAHLTTAFQRMLSEPKSKQSQADILYRLVVVNNQLTSYLATLSYQLDANENLSAEQLKQLRSIWFVLKETYEKVSGTELQDVFSHNATALENDLLHSEFLREVHQTAVSIRKTAIELTLGKQIG